MLAQKLPKSFISGANVNLKEVLKQVNSREFHHIFPKKFLEGFQTPREKIQQLANFCFLNNQDNQKIKAKDPKIYKDYIQDLENVMAHALCPPNALDLSYDQFIKERVKILKNFADDLIN